MENLLHNMRVVSLGLFSYLAVAVLIYSQMNEQAWYIQLVTLGITAFSIFLINVAILACIFIRLVTHSDPTVSGPLIDMIMFNYIKEATGRINKKYNIV